MRGPCWLSDQTHSWWWPSPSRGLSHFKEKHAEGGKNKPAKKRRLLGFFQNMTAVLQTQLVAAYSNKLVAMMPVSGRSPEAQAASATANLAQAIKKAEASVQLKALFLRDNTRMRDLHTPAGPGRVLHFSCLLSDMSAAHVLRYHPASIRRVSCTN